MASAHVFLSLAMLVCTLFELVTADQLHLLGLAPRKAESTKSPEKSKRKTISGSTKGPRRTKVSGTTASPNDGSLEKIYLENEIVPQIINHTPKLVCEVEYGEVKINFGNNLTADEIEERPTLVKWPAKRGVYYTLLMFGADVPTRQNPCGFMWRHWAVGNIPQNDIDKGFTMVEYENTEPFYRAGFHRVLFFIYQQRGRRKFNFTSSKGVIKKGAPWEERGVWYMEDFLAKFNLTEPIAANFFFLYDLNPHPEITTKAVLYQ